MNWIGWLLAIPAMAMTVFGIGCSEHQALPPISAMLEAALHSTRPAADHLSHDATTRSPGDELFAAAATFTLLAWGFAYAYSRPARPGIGQAASLVSSRNGLRTLMELLFYEAQ